MDESIVKKIKESVTKSGTTIVGIRGKDFAVVLGDTQASMGHMVATEKAQKVYIISKYAGFGAAGADADIQFLKKVLQLENENHKIRYEEELDVDELTSIAYNILFGRYYELPFAPLMVAPVFGGYSISDRKFKVYSLDPIGGIVEEDYVAEGSGSIFAISVLDNEYKEDISLKEALELGIKAINSAKKRDIYTGGRRIDAVIITKDYVKLLKGKELEEFIKGLQ